MSFSSIRNVPRQLHDAFVEGQIALAFQDMPKYRLVEGEFVDDMDLIDAIMAGQSRKSPERDVFDSGVIRISDFQDFKEIDVRESYVLDVEGTGERMTMYVSDDELHGRVEIIWVEPNEDASDKFQPLIIDVTRMYRR